MIELKGMDDSVIRCVIPDHLCEKELFESFITSIVAEKIYFRGRVLSWIFRGVLSLFRLCFKSCRNLLIPPAWKFFLG